jgi:hypothetical protein
MAQVLYTPVKAFKKIIENPKYLGVLLVFVLFLGLQFGFEYVQFAKTQVENTTPSIGELAQYTNATLWTNSTGVSLSNNYADYFNYTVYAGSSIGYYNLFTNYTNTKGPSSLEIDAPNANSASATLQDLFNVNCAPNGFENLSMTLKLVSPQTVPQSATLTLYSLNDSNYYNYQLTSSLSTTSLINVWQNLTIPLGPASQGWTTNGAPNWGNITAIKLDFTYPADSNITIRIGGLFFRGQYESPLSFEGAVASASFLEAYSLQFIFTWLLLTGLIYLLFKAFKAPLTWKPLFVAVAFAMFVMVVRALVGFLATFTLNNLYFPYDASIGSAPTILGAISYPSQMVGLLSAQSQAAVNAVLSATSGFSTLVLALFVISYVWLGYLCTVIIGHINPAFSMTKRIGIAGVSVGLTIFLLLLFSIPI